MGKQQADPQAALPESADQCGVSALPASSPPSIMWPAGKPLVQLVEVAPGAHFATVALLQLLPYFVPSQRICFGFLRLP